jgi:hypothetical protein
LAHHFPHLSWRLQPSKISSNPPIPFGLPVRSKQDIRVVGLGKGENPSLQHIQ